MWRFLLFLACVLTVQAANIKDEKWLKAVRQLLVELERESSSAGKENAVKTSTPVASAAVSTTPSVTQEEQPNEPPKEYPVTDMQEAEAYLREHFPHLFAVSASDVTDMVRLSEAMQVVAGMMLEPDMMHLKPCIHLAQLIGAIRHSLTREMMPGNYESLREVIDHAILESGLEMDLRDDLVHRIESIIYKPLMEALENLECSIELLQCNDIDENQSPSEKLYASMHEHLKSRNMADVSAGDVVVKFFSIGEMWFRQLHMTVCDEYAVEIATEKLHSAVMEVEESLTSIDLMRKLLIDSLDVSGRDELELVDRIAETIYKEHFVDHYLSLHLVKKVLDHSERMGLDSAVIELNARMLEMIYWTEVDFDLIEEIYTDLTMKISRQIMMAPLHLLTVENMISASKMVLESITEHWETKCLKARTIGKFAGLAEVHRVATKVMHPEVMEMLQHISNVLHVSIVDPKFRKLVDFIYETVGIHIIDKISDTIHGIVGRQPTEVVFIEIERLLKNPSLVILKAQDLIHLVLQTTVPLLGHDHMDESTFVCEISDQDLLTVANKIYELHAGVNDMSLVRKLNQTIYEKLHAEFPSVPAYKLAVLSGDIIRRLNDKVMNDVLKTFEQFEVTDKESEIFDVMIDFLSVSFGNFVHDLVVGRPQAGPPMTSPPVQPSPPPEEPEVPHVPHGENPALEFMHWQQELITGFVMQYIQGMSQYTSKHMDLLMSSHPCEEIPGLCEMITRQISHTMSSYMPADNN